MKTNVEIFLFFALIGVIGSHATVSSNFLTFEEDDLKELFKNAKLDRLRYPKKSEQGSARAEIQQYLKRELSRIGAISGAQYSQHEFQTQVVEEGFGGQEFDLTGTNFMLNFPGNVSNEMDEPLVIVANYDTASDQGNPIDDNGSGVVGLLALSSLLARQISKGKVHLEHSILFGALDVSIYKYNEDLKPTGSTPTGASEMAGLYLRNYLKDKKRLKGVIVLDTLMNYNAEPNSQSGKDFQESFPEAHKQMSSNSFKGTFLGAVYRDNLLDKPLMSSFESGWNNAIHVLESKSQDYQSNTTSLIKFLLKKDIKISPAVTAFLALGQEPFWNHHLARTKSEIAAIVLTDTVIFRQHKCQKEFDKCNMQGMMTKENLSFLKTSLMAVHSTALELQATTFGDNGAGASQFSMTSISISVLSSLLLRYLLIST